ncbi:MAG: LacI family DNA-binding transcriptional regulator [Bilifractor sp.]|jgi:LacI family transcriptional regulator
MATIKDIAKISGYSIGTVSRVINHHPDVSEKARERIEKVIRETNYEPNSNAKLLKQGTNSAITFIVRGYNNVFLQGILEKMQILLDRAGEETAVDIVDEKDNEVLEALHLSVSRKPKGFLFLGGNTGNFRKYFEKIKVPSVLLTNSAKGLDFPNLSSFSTDDEAAAEFAIHYLFQCGHRVIGLVGGSPDNRESQAGYQRLKGCRNALAECGLTPDDDYYEPSRFSMRGGYDAAGKLLKRHPDITAIFALSDTIALGVIRAMQDMGLSCPGDISVLGYDGIDIGRYTVPRLTTISQNSDQIARLSVSDLLLHLHYPQAEAVHQTVQFRLSRGESVRKRESFL